MSLIKHNYSTKYLIVNIKYHICLPIHLIRYQLYFILDSQFFDINEKIKLIQSNDRDNKILSYYIIIYNDNININRIKKYLHTFLKINYNILISIACYNKINFINELNKKNNHIITIYKKNKLWYFICRYYHYYNDYNDNIYLL